MKPFFSGLLMTGLIALCGKPALAQIPGDTLLNVTYETGTTSSGYTGVSATNATAGDAAYMVQPGATGNWAIAHKIVYGDQGYWSDGNWRSESDAIQYLPARYFPGDFRRYEFSVLLKDWTPWNTGDLINETNLFQLKISGNATTESGVPLQVRTQRNALRLRYVDNTRVFDILSDVRPYVNQWIRFRIDAKWTTDATGYIRTYMKLPGQSDFVLADEKTDYATFAGDVSAGNVGYIKWGLYVTPENVTRIAYHDDIRIIDMTPPPSAPGLIWGNSIPDPNPAYLDGPYTKPSSITSPSAYNNTSGVYIHPYIKYQAPQNIVYFNSTSPAPDPADNVVGTPWSDFSRNTLGASGQSGTPPAPGPGGRYLLNGWANGTVATPSALDPAEYYEFRLEPKDGAYFNFTHIQFTVRRATAAAPTTFVLRSSVDGFVSNISDPVTVATVHPATSVVSFDASALTGTGNAFVVPAFVRSEDPVYASEFTNRGGPSQAFAFAPSAGFLKAAALANVNGPVTFRLYAYGATANNTAVTLDNFEFYGQVLPIALPVNFSGVSANFSGEALHVNWMTTSETSNRYFEIQASGNGKDFTTVKTIRSKNSNSTTVQNYEAIIAPSEMAGLMVLPLLMGFLGMAGSKRNKAAAWVTGMVLMVIAGVSCSKYNEALLTAGRKNIYIRIKQVDADGRALYSKVVQVTANE